MSEAVPPEDFIASLTSLRDGATHPGIEYEELPSPTRMAPWTAAVGLRTRAHDFGQPRSAGRLVILHDPEGQAGWNGSFRIVAQMRSQIDSDMGHDPLLSEALWQWAHDCLDEAGAGYHDMTGTVTREISESFGGLILKGATLHVELRASWTPNTPYLGEHLQAWAMLMLRSAGVESSLHLEGV
ncbi:DUF3000 family protein [Schaalia suimastitidis]|uniref:DUF3000 family protein n=1 Tax=Schaalia suimastitidis TaxID=121163 RepID=UPI000406748A|nr:DUF3000 family protein [Schaalia suimastitidis]